MRLVCEVDPARRTVTVYGSATDGVMLLAGDALDGEDVLPGFRLAFTDLFAELDRQR